MKRGIDGERSRASGEHGGAAPIPPFGEMKKGRRKESPCGRQSTGEHLLPGKLTFSAACGAANFLHPIIRV